MKQKLVYSVLACIFLILLMTVSCTTGGKHTHSWTEWNDVKNASCSSNGLRERECISCGKNETEIIASAGHQFSEWVVKDNGSCMNAGYKERSCSVCHETEQQEIAPTGHAYGDFEQILLPTCTEEGNKQKVCSICNDVVQEPIPATGHTYAGNQCTQCNHLIESSGLKFSSNGDGTCLIIGPGSCNDAHLIIPSHSPEGDKVIGIAGGTSLVGDGVFTNCDHILSVTFPDTMETIGEEAFSGCDGLTSIHIPASITSINHSAFMECENLTTLTVDPNNTVYHSAGNCIIETARKMIVVGAKNSVIPNDGSVTEIGFYSFYGRDVKEIFVPDGITTIGYMAFYGCTNLRKMILPDSVKGIQPYAFCYCYNLTSVTVGSGLEYIHSDAFSSCDKLVEVINNSNFNIVAGSGENEKIAYYALFVHNGETKIENWHNYLFITYSGKNYLLGYVGDNATLNLPASYNGQGYEIYKYAFYGNKNIVSITIPETVSKIGDWAFRACSSLVTVNYLGTDIQWNEIIPENNRLGISSDIVKYASEHTHIAVVDPAVAPSCTKTGLTEGAHCLICNEVLLEQTVVPVAGHSYGDWHEVPANACAGGTYSIRVCTTCFDVEYSDEYTGILHPHDFEMELNSPTCTESGDVQIVCRKCGVIGAQETLSPLGHNLGWEANAEGHYLACRRDNCDHKTSLETHTMAETSLCVDASCTVCGYFMREGLGHIWGNEYQSDENGHWYVCTRDDCHQTTFYGKHQHADAICTDTSANCDICGKEFVPDGNHGMGEWQQTKAPTCTENGERRRDCEYCDYYETRTISANGHKMGAWQIIQAPTETQDGIERRDCRICDHYETRSVAATGHHFGNWYVTKEPTCTVAGEKRRDCSHCSYYELRTVSALGHTCSNWTQTQAPTCTDYGSAYGYCIRCGEYMTRDISPLDHAWSSYRNDSTHHWEVCTRCYTQTTRIAHSGGQNTCTDAAKCSACGYAYGQAIGHDYETVYSATDNTHYYRCKNGCGIRKNETVHKLTAKTESMKSTDDGAQIKYIHTLSMVCDVCGYQKVINTVVGSEHYGCKILHAVEPTCTKSGLTWGWICAVPGCNEVYQAQETIPALGHNYVNGVCTRCGKGGTGGTPGGNQPGDKDTPDKHTCVGIAWIIAKAPTCTEKGEKQFICSCGKSLKTQTLSAKGHTEVLDPAVAPTCTETGLTEGKHCSVCSQVLVEQKVVKALGHTTVVDKAVAPTCTETGLTEGKHCATCGEVFIVQKVVDARGHTAVTDVAVDPTCTKTGLTEGSHCSACREVFVKQERVDALGHDEISHAAKAPTCTEIGWNAYVTCSRCSYTTYREIKATGHTEVVDRAVAPTCTENGLTEGKHCSVCEVILATQKVVYALGHTEVIDPAVAPTCTETGLTQGKHCSVCKDVLAAQNVVDALGHTEVIDPAVAPTCIKTGLTEGKHCSVCEVVLVAQNVVDAWGHTEVIDPAVAPTCTETGLTEGKHCSVCKVILLPQSVVNALGHTEVVDRAVAPTCTEIGLTEGKHCSVCKVILLPQSVVNALGHTEVVDRAVAPTCTDAGLTEGSHCSVCREVLVEQERVDALGHDEISHGAKAPTCTKIGWDAYVTCSRCDYTTFVEKAVLGHSMEGDMCTRCMYPYIPIYTADDLRKISSDLSGQYILMCDIDLGGVEWTPIGYKTPFEGIINGNGYVISNFKVTGSIGLAGLFGRNEGTIQNLGVKNFTIDSINSLFAGGLVGYNRGTISNCYTMGDISISNYGCAGGLIGECSSGEINNCYAIVDVYASAGDGSSICAGGLIGSINSNSVLVNYCYATGNISIYSPESGYWGYAGGLSGTNYGKISNCYATGDVTASIISSSSYAGGLVGDNDGTISDCHATGDVISNSYCSYAGGLVGYNSGSGAISNCYATGDVNSSSSSASYSIYAGGLVGYTYGAISNCYHYSGQSFVVKKGSSTSYSATSTEGTAMDMPTLQSVSFHASTLGWDPAIWNFVEGQHPTLK